MQLHRERGRTPASQRYVVSRQVHTLKAISFLEIAQAALKFLSIGELGIHEIRNSAVGARTHRLHNQRIGRRLVPGVKRRDDVHNSRLVPAIVNRQLNESDQRLAIERSDVNAGVEISSAHFGYGLEVLAVMRKSPSLANRRLVINLKNPASERLVKRYFLNHHTFFFCLFGFIPRLKSDLFVPPLVKGG